MLLKISITSLPLDAFSTSALNWSIAMVDEWSGVKLPAIRSFSCADAVGTPSAAAMNRADKVPVRNRIIAVSPLWRTRALWPREYAVFYWIACLLRFVAAGGG